MSIETIRSVLLWCAATNFGILLLWFTVFALAHDRMYQHHRRWFRLSVEQFDMLQYTLMGIYKLGIILFLLVPYIVLLIVA